MQAEKIGETTSFTAFCSRVCFTSPYDCNHDTCKIVQREFFNFNNEYIREKYIIDGRVPVEMLDSLILEFHNWSQGRNVYIRITNVWCAGDSKYLKKAYNNGYSCVVGDIKKFKTDTQTEFDLKMNWAIEI